MTRKRTKPKKAKAEKVLPVATWKRVVILCFAVLFLAIAILFATRPADQLNLTELWQWVIATLFGLAGIWFVTIALWGRRKEVDETLNVMRRGI